MKTHRTSPAALVTSLASVATAAAAGFVSLNALNLLPVIGGAGAASLVALAFADYRRKPRVQLPRLHSDRTPATRPQRTPDHELTWTCHTFSA